MGILNESAADAKRGYTYFGIRFLPDTA